MAAQVEKGGAGKNGGGWVGLDLLLEDDGAQHDGDHEGGKDQS